MWLDNHSGMRSIALHAHSGTSTSTVCGIAGGH
jgi:hypothetical protein